MKKEAGWIYSPRVISVLAELARKPLTPMQLRVNTCMTKNNYVNIILKKLEAEGIVKCMNPEEKIGRVFCINPQSRKMIEGIFRKRKIRQEITPLPKLNWTAYGRLSCRYCRQLRKVLKKAYELKHEGREMTLSNLKKKLPGMATSNLYRALDRLIELRAMACKNTGPREFMITEEGLAIMEFDSVVI